MYEIDETQIKKWWEVFKKDQLVEIRLLGKNTYSGYFTNVETLISALKPMLDGASSQYYGNVQAYFTLNDVNPSLYSREQRDTFIKKPKSTTTDNDIIRRRFVMIDIDPNRAAGISSSDEEFEKAHLKCVDVYRYLMANGFKEPIISKSGNGWHCYVTCDMPNDDAHTDLIKRFLQSISKQFSDEFCEIDEKVFNAARIDKLIGTWAKKGSDSPTRRWRMATLVKVPNDLSPNDESLFSKIADLVPREQPQTTVQQRGQFGSEFSLSSWLKEHGIVFREKPNGSGTIYELENCPWIESHSDRKKWDSALFKDSNGKITFNCHHSHCKDKTWQQFRLFYEPNAYDKKPQPQRMQYQQQRRHYEIKDELPDRKSVV